MPKPRVSPAQTDAALREAFRSTGGERLGWDFGEWLARGCPPLLDYEPEQLAAVDAHTVDAPWRAAYMRGAPA
jgi:hypothetical protein